MNRIYTWKPDLPDARDFRFTPTLTSLPALVDLRSRYNYVYDQGELGSCTGNSISMAIDMERVKQKLPAIHPSRLFIYYNERVIEGTVNQDSGAQIRDGIKTVSPKGQGYCPEAIWAYNIHRFTQRPSNTVFNIAATNKVKQYQRLDNTKLGDLKACLAQGFPFVFGFTVYDSFESEVVSKTGVVPMPNFQSESVLGGHAVCCVGYDDHKQSFIVRNSWGTSWGDKGHFYIPYAYLTNNNLADDFWTIQLV